MADLLDFLVLAWLENETSHLSCRATTVAENWKHADQDYAIAFAKQMYLRNLLSMST